MADFAMREALSGRQELSEWIALFDRIASVTGGSGDRDLVGHSTVKKEVTETLGPVVSGGGHLYGFGPYGMELGRMILQETHYRVSQDQIQIMAGTKKPKDADFDSLFDTCNAVVSILNDLDALLKRM